MMFLYCYQTHGNRLKPPIARAWVRPATNKYPYQRISFYLEKKKTRLNKFL